MYKRRETADSAEKNGMVLAMHIQKAMFERWRKVSSGISEHSKSGAQRQILRTVRVLSDSASKTGSPFKESWLAEGKTER